MEAEPQGGRVPLTRRIPDPDQPDGDQPHEHPGTHHPRREPHDQSIDGYRDGCSGYRCHRTYDAYSLGGVTPVELDERQAAGQARATTEQQIDGSGVASPDDGEHDDPSHHGGLDPEYGRQQLASPA